MMAVIDKNVLVSGLLSPTGNASAVIAGVISGRITLCYDYRIFSEYRDVLSRPKFHFRKSQVDALLDFFEHNGISVVPAPLPDVNMPDDRPFYEVAKYCEIPLVTGNMRHFPDDPLVMGLADFVQKYI